MKTTKYDKTGIEKLFLRFSWWRSVRHHRREIRKALRNPERKMKPVQLFDWDAPYRGEGWVSSKLAAAKSGAMRFGTVFLSVVIIMLCA
jgi:hypothetical protein